MRPRVVWRRTADLDAGEVLEAVPVVGMCRNELPRKLDIPRKLRVEFFGEPETVPSSRDGGRVSSFLDAGGGASHGLRGKEGAQSRGFAGELVIKCDPEG